MPGASYTMLGGELRTGSYPRRARTIKEKGFSDIMKRTSAALLVTFALLALPGLALASGNSTNQGYSSPIQSVQDTGASRPNAPNADGSTGSSVSPASAAQATETTNASSSLPFTGIDVVLLAAGGAVLLGAGLAVRRLSGDNS